MVWQFMKAQEEQNRILKIGFKNFYIVTNVLYVYMKLYTVMCTEYQTKFKVE